MKSFFKTLLMIYFARLKKELIAFLISKIIEFLFQ